MKEKSVASNIGRILTLVVEISDDEKAKHIWENHSWGYKSDKHKTSPFGFRVLKISDDDVVARCHVLEEMVDEYEGYEKP
ncbi:MAG: hypothetical protein KBA81_06925 [Rhabdochlamydiaceae bacterium]|nr:hypothetical protein [Rhabdochlamydiaceae bacterium]